MGAVQTSEAQDQNFLFFMLVLDRILFPNMLLRREPTCGLMALTIAASTVASCAL
jgi:hypothetical protein